MLLQPLMLAWIGGAALPLVLHLLSKSRYRAVPWGAMMFLNGVDAGSHHAARIKQIVLLLCRMGVIGFLAVALARPVISARYSAVPTAGLTTGGPAAVVIILDDSASMGYTQTGKSRLDDARQITLQILGSLKRGDQATLLLAGSREYHPVTPPSTDLQSIAGRVTDLQPSTGAADFALEINRAADLLEHVSPAEGEIDIVCDHQALNWRNITDAFKQRWISRRGPSPRLTVFPVGNDESDNVAIDAIEIPDHLFVRGEPSVVQVRVHNYGSTSQPSVPVSLWSAARTLGDTTVGVPARSTKSVAIPVKFYEAGSRVLSASVHSTGLTTDDRLDVAADVVEPSPSLRINGAKAVNRNLSPGQPIVAIVDEPVEDQSATVQFSPGGTRELAITNSTADHTEIRYVKTLNPGTYRLRYRTAGREKILNYVVPTPRADSDLTNLTENQWKTLQDRLAFHRIDLAKTTIAQAMDVQRGGREIWIDLLAAVLLLMTAEMFLSRQWGMAKELLPQMKTDEHR